MVKDKEEMKTTRCLTKPDFNFNLANEISFTEDEGKFTNSVYIF